MADLFDYLQWRGDLTFTQDPPNAVDALIFSALSYLSLGGKVEADPGTPVFLNDASEDFFRLTDVSSRCRAKADLSLLMAASETVRFGKTRIVQYRDMLIPEEETQFSAVTFLLDDGSAFLAFRGTDYSLVGWKEDFNMSFQETIPAQRLALQYTTDIANMYPLPLRLAGHSKGGNLAVFAAVKTEANIQKRILGVYNHDGPGFTDYVMNDPAYKEMVPRIQTIIPQSSVIGMLLEHEEPYTIIKSKQLGVLQHELYSWEVIGKHFVPMEEITADSRFLNQTIKHWLSGMTNQERNEIVDALYELLTVGNVDNVLEIIHPKNIRNYLRTLNTNSKIRKILSEELLGLMEAARKTQLALENNQAEKETSKTEEKSGGN